MKLQLPILSLAALAPLAPLAAAHFQLKYPTSQGGSEEEMVNFPCGGGTQSSNRTQVSISAGSFPVALSMGHSQTAVEVLLALGSDPGSNYNIVLHQTFEIQGLGAFCLPHVVFDESILGTNITDGMNATVQVQSNGDPTGGLYACADIQFSSTAKYSEPSSCSNNTGVRAVSFSGDAAKRNANESTAAGEAQSSSSSSSSSSTSSGSKTATSTAGAATETVVWGMLGAAVLGGMALV
ncbi:hypothetical protein BO71DRAFT_384651 [Aspergillus ellipticus CBS 707.79]|uniref:Copper acquisition factor BIM1-like domain-containing protein n=1 Tax=Aspergillus ellipticus CBS 707.79 TaxID=1448320 RepID=A0A319D496_9EURO|nr:hypothetical protein BO71DRAFT_384651 [Aspergillus ellipticus CBS 707.79]